MSSVALHIVRDADIWVNTAKAALMVGKDASWVTRNKEKFVFRRKPPAKHHLEYELASILKVIKVCRKDTAA